MNIPSNILYTKEHEWVRIEDDYAIVGITDYAQSELGDIVFIEFPNINDKFDQNEAFGVVEAVKTVSDLFIPLSTEILEINHRLEENPELINSDPYGDGWIVKLSLFKKNELEMLLSSEDYKKIIS